MEPRGSLSPLHKPAIDPYLQQDLTKMEGGTERHLPKTDNHVVGSAGECCKDVRDETKK